MKGAGEQRGDPLLVQTSLGGFGQPPRQPAFERLLMTQAGGSGTVALLSCEGLSAVMAGTMTSRK